MKHFYILSIILLITKNTNAQNIPCSSPEAKQFDFWLGEWDLTYNDTSKAHNTVTKQLNNCVIEENFKDPSQNFNGRSWSVYNSQLKKWQQTWVDDAGAYLDFIGEFKDGKMQLNRDFANPKGQLIMQRMIFYDITKDSFTWNWESSKDNGKTWNLDWKIYYKRIK